MTLIFENLTFSSTYLLGHKNALHIFPNKQIKEPQIKTENKYPVYFAPSVQSNLKWDDSFDISFSTVEIYRQSSVKTPIKNFK